MKKKNLFWVGMLLLMLAGASSCNKDDDYNSVLELSDYNNVQEFNDNNKENFIGTWHVLHHSSGWGINDDYDSGEVTVTFTKNGEMIVDNKRDDQRPFPTGTLTYTFVDIEQSIFTGEPRTCIYLNFLSVSAYSYTFDKGFLYLSQEAYDGDGYTFQKLK